MKILTVEYRKLRSIPNTYDNAAVGATAEVGAYEDADTVMGKLREFVEGELDSIVGEAKETSRRGETPSRVEAASAEEILRQLLVGGDLRLGLAPFADDCPASSARRCNLKREHFEVLMRRFAPDHVDPRPE